MTRAVICGDLHLYDEVTNAAAVRGFLDRITRDPPNVLILGGDIYELWRRDLSGAMWMASEFTEAIIDLSEQATDVVYISGNHDDYLRRHTADADRYPFEPVLNYRTTIDGLDIFVTHGHKYEPTYNPITNDVLALTDDHAGRVATWFWSNRPLPNNPVEQVGLFLAGPGGGFLDPESAGTNDFRRRAIKTGIRQETNPGEWGIYGHTHLPAVDGEDRIANWGSMTGDRGTYIEVEGSEVRLREV